MEACRNRGAVHWVRVYLAACAAGRFRAIASSWLVAWPGVVAFGGFGLIDDFWIAGRVKLLVLVLAPYNRLVRIFWCYT